MRHPYTFTKRICYKVDWLFEDLTAIFLRAAAIELHTNDRKMIPYIIGEILIYVSSKMSSKYGGKKMSHLGGCWWDYENLGLDKDVTLEKMKQVLRSEFEEKNVIKVWEDLPPIEWSDEGFNYNSTPKGSNEADYEILKDIIFWRLKVKWTAERCTLCQIFMSWAMRVMIKRVQKFQFADLIKDMVSNDKVLKKFCGKPS
ncbi:hypothetical protein MtrunA17_Chr8g0335191 [Medicago truncatula]|uniref:Uncharacterized protein n=1 Tax=Medicago truncatula TaxID=3880 RepID=A0A396GA10_MEDTR|nr:hypothetical protein MtrunA17_Chr8g0335191 [Medicago truncatula]